MMVQFGITLAEEARTLRQVVDCCRAHWSVSCDLLIANEHLGGGLERARKVAYGRLRRYSWHVGLPQRDGRRLAGVLGPARSRFLSERLMSKGSRALHLEASSASVSCLAVAYNRGRGQ